MNRLIGAAMMAVSLSASAGLALAEEPVSEARSVDARVLKVRLEGAIDLVLKQGPTPSLVVSGEKRQVSKVITSVVGDTLRIDTERTDTWHFGKSERRQLHAELTLPNLNALESNGVGSSVVTGFSGEMLRLSLDGAGSVNVTSRYKNFEARLGGVGSMTLNAVDSERIDVNLRGAGQISVTGKTKLLHAQLGGVGSLDAPKLYADTVDLDMTGLGSANVFARTTANLTLTGLGSATVYGKPANRNSTARGLGSVRWE
jgi:hypothetical protein